MRSHILLVVLLIASSTAWFQAPTLLLSSEGVGALRFCEPLARVDSLWSNVTDTSITSEEVEWPAKIAHLPGGSILFESSWIDDDHVWRVSTDLPSARSRSGIHVGMTVGDLRDLGVQPTVKVPEGILVLVVDADGIALTVDSTAEVRFHTAGEVTLEVVPRDARIVRLHARGDACK